MDYRQESPPVIRDFLAYHETIKGHSQKTVEEYFLDLRTFFRFIKQQKKLAPEAADFDKIDILDVDLNLIRSVSLSDIYDYMSFLSRDRVQNPREADPKRGLKNTSRARKVASIRSFYKYLTVKAKLLDENPVSDLDSPVIGKKLPRFLTLDESVALLDSVSGTNMTRDYCILAIFLNCGLRISELTGLNVADVSGETIRILGKGGKERVLFLNDACRHAIDEYLKIRPALKNEKALFLSRNGKRLSRNTVHHIVKQRLLAAGLDSEKLSAHKLRHTAATLMLQNGVDLRTLQEILGHEHLNTTQIYTHVESVQLREAANANPLSKIRKKKT